MLLSDPPGAAETPEEPIPLVAGDRGRPGALSRTLRRAFGEVEVAGSLRGAVDAASDVTLVGVHYDALSSDEREELVADFAKRADRTRLLLFSDGSALQDLPRLFGSHALTNMLMIKESGLDVDDLLVTVQKLRRGEIFGLDKYFGWGVESRGLQVTASSEKAGVLQIISEYADKLGVAPRLRSAIRVVADEFLANALYNAPVATDGSPRHATRSRVEPVALEPGEAIDVRYCCDGRRFGVSVSDPFGSLAPERLQDYLAQCFRRGENQVNEGPGGAGIGFYTILDSLSHFVVNIEAGVRTEFIGLVEVSGGYRRFVESGKSFNLFFARERAR